MTERRFVALVAIGLPARYNCRTSDNRRSGSSRRTSYNRRSGSSRRTSSRSRG